VNGDAERRRELGKFLRSRREQLARGPLGLPPARRRDTGLRREEVAYLSGLSITWYTWLEQGRQIMPSRQVLDAIARTLCLSGPEHAYVLALVGYSALHFDAEPMPSRLPGHVQRLLDALDHLPAYVLAPDWTILGWTRTFSAIYPNVTTVPDEDRNLLWLVFTDPSMHDLLGDWQLHGSRKIAEFRADAGPFLTEPPFAPLVARLLEESEHFGAVWERPSIEGFTSRERIYRHPVVGELHLEQHQMTLSDNPPLNVVFETPTSGTDTAARLQQLVGDPSHHRNNE
jgi:MmyB-like transcription regulator ligand binding domain/Helix-turn-helix domain